jgi:hypothetical protein
VPSACSSIRVLIPAQSDRGPSVSPTGPGVRISPSAGESLKARCGSRRPVIVGIISTRSGQCRRWKRQAVQVLDLLLEYFGERGERWARHRYDDGDGRRCLVGALSYLRCKHRIPSENAECFLQEAMKQGLPFQRGGLVYFNDRCRSLAELRSVIIEARARLLLSVHYPTVDTCSA